MGESIQNMYIPSVSDAVKKIIVYYNSGNYEGLRTVKEYLSSENESKFIAGDADRFHNATVSLTRVGFFDYAYALAEVGQNRYPKNTDLLGDLLCYGLQCRSLGELEKWYSKLQAINKRFWTWRAYQFSFDYWMARLPEAENDQQLKEWEETVSQIITSFKNNFKYLKDQSDCEKAFMMDYEFRASQGENDAAIAALIEATTNERTKNKCPQCALKLADHFFASGDYATSLKYADKAVSIKEDQPSISLGYTHYIRAMSTEYVERESGGWKQNISKIYNAYAAAIIHLKDESDRQRLIDSVRKQVEMLERESGIESNIDFKKSEDMDSVLRTLLSKRNSSDDE